MLAPVSDAFNVSACGSGSGVGVGRCGACSSKRCCRPLWFVGQELKRALHGQDVAARRMWGIAEGRLDFQTRRKMSQEGSVPVSSAAHRCLSWNRKK